MNAFRFASQLNSQTEKANTLLLSAPCFNYCPSCVPNKKRLQQKCKVNVVLQSFVCAFTQHRSLNEPNQNRSFVGGLKNTAALQALLSMCSFPNNLQPTVLTDDQLLFSSENWTIGTTLVVKSSIKLFHAI